MKKSKTAQKAQKSAIINDARAILAVAAYTVAFIVGAIAPFVTHAANDPVAPSVTLLTINGAAPTSHCIAGPISITGSGTTGQQGGTWHLNIDWGDGSNTKDPNDPIDGAKNDHSFTFSASHTPVKASTGITVTLYHSQEEGSDGKVVISVNQCMAAPTQGVVTIIKNVVNDDTGTTTPGNFTLHINGQDFAGSSSGTDFQLSAGTYPITENARAGYTQTGISCVGNDLKQTNGSIVVVAGKNYTCTVTNDDDAPPAAPTCSIHGDPQTINAGQPFSLQWTSASATLASLDHNINIQNALSGSFSFLGGSPPNGLLGDQTYTLSVSGTGGNAQCQTTIKVNRIQGGTLTVIKHVINDDGGKATADQFAMSMSAGANFDDASPKSFSGSETGTQITVEGFGRYEVKETGGPSGYNATYSADCSGTMPPGGSKTCTVTNDDVAVAPTDVCPNIEGVQTSVPEGMHLSDGQCVKNDGGSNGGGNATPPPAPPAPPPAPTGNGPIIGSLGGGNGPIAGSLGGFGGQVLGASTTTVSKVSAACSPLLHAYMRMGMKNDALEVKKLQKFLNDELNAGLPITGFFGKQTDAAVRKFQMSHEPQILTPWGITGPTGYVYKTTQRWINLTACAGLDIPMPKLD